MTRVFYLTITDGSNAVYGAHDFGVGGDGLPGQIHNAHLLSLSEIQRDLPITFSNFPGTNPMPLPEFSGGHRLVLTDGRKLRNCHYCEQHCVKTKSGYTTRTRYYCQKCNVPLCVGRYRNRNCFVDYHNTMNQIND